MIAFRFEISASSVCELSWKTSSNCCRALFPRAHQVLHRELQREQRILEFVRQAASQFAPGRDSFGLHQSLFLREQFVVMRLKESASSASSSLPATSTRVFQFPAATSRAARASSTTGRVTRAAAQLLSKRASTIPPLPTRSAESNTPL